MSHINQTKLHLKLLVPLIAASTDNKKCVLTVQMYKSVQHHHSSVALSFSRYKQESGGNGHFHLKVQSYRGNTIYANALCACFVRSYGKMNCRIAQKRGSTVVYAEDLLPIKCFCICAFILSFAELSVTRTGGNGVLKLNFSAEDTC